MKTMNSFKTTKEYYRYCAEKNLVPQCPICKHELIIRQVQMVQWKWDKNGFIKSTLDVSDSDPHCCASYDDDSDVPFCMNCGYSNWVFMLDIT